MSAIARSPISQVAPVAIVGGWEVSQRRSDAALRLCDLSAMAKVLVKSDAHSTFATSHSTAFGSARTIDNGVLEVGCDPGAWLLIGAAGSTAELLAMGNASASASSDYVTVIDVSHGRAMMRLTGADSFGLLSKLCAIDLRDAITPNRSAFRSSVAKLVTDVIREDLADGTLSYLLHCERSSGQHLFNCVLDAGAEFGIDVEGSN